MIRCHPIRSIVGAAVFLVAAAAFAAGSITLKHIHGLSFSADGTQLFIPSHDGLAIHSKDGWSVAPGPRHDYMGFAVTREFFYSSGHPAPGSPLQNPFGLIKSPDGGQTWQSLGLAGEADFHLLATGYQTNAVYVVSAAPNSRMPQPGLYVTTDDGNHWQQASKSGLSAGRLRSLAVHPTQAQVVAVGGDNGLYLSQDSGENFQRLVEGIRVLAIFFAFDGDSLWFSSLAEQPTLTRRHWQTGASVALTLPPLHRDAVSYIAQNPTNQQEWAIATFKRNVYLSSDHGQTWRQIAKQGMTL